MSTALAPTEQLLYTAEEAATVLRLGRSTVYELMAAGELRFVKRGRSRRIKRSALEAFVDSLEPQPV
ncbi:helix-turn-helix domain-containing protein [Streptomyces sp. NBC_00414]|uniref:Helix-turn-helix domain-containing protein n=1 Tax=Streptomyces liliiviolaceus TaxID=2823109 RepID=A0A940XVS1_9ACTN|nr:MULTISPECIES: helix-turn-helix domain-containing protein [Streptomyces]MBQ0847470.1 helix-turn-helix domain-containing protein [Streptomyces liliiviolaceus]